MNDVSQLSVLGKRTHAQATQLQLPKEKMSLLEADEMQKADVIDIDGTQSKKPKLV